MKKALTFIFFFCLIFQLQAQITIEKADFTSEANVPVNNWPIIPSSVTIPNGGEDMIWDYSDIALGSDYSFVLFEADNPNFPNSDFADPSQTSVFGGVAFLPLVFYSSLKEDGRYTDGRISESLNLPLGSITGGANDTLTFLESVNVYQEPVYSIKFPATYGSTWSYDISYTIDLLISVAAFGVNRTPSANIITSSSRDTIIGYGTLILPHPDGSGTVSIDVLLHKQELTAINNYTLGGQPAPQIMLDALGLVQGEESKATRYVFFGKGFPRSVMYINVEESGGISFANLSDEIRNFPTTSVAEVSKMIETSVFPNPTSGEFSLQFFKSDNQEWSLDIMNSLGQIVHNQRISEHHGNIDTRIRLEARTQGMHHYSLRNATGAVVASGTILIMQ